MRFRVLYVHCSGITNFRIEFDLVNFLIRISREVRGFGLIFYLRITFKCHGQWGIWVMSAALRRFYVVHR